MKRGALALGVDTDTVDAELERVSNRLLKSDTSNYQYIRRRLLAQFESAAEREPRAGRSSDQHRHPQPPDPRLPHPVHEFLSSDLDADELMARNRGSEPDGHLPPSQGVAHRLRHTDGGNELSTSARRSSVGYRANTPLWTTSRCPGAEEPASPKCVGAYGGTRREDRERLITVFNTPFAPDILVASSVMGEGIDLHQECPARHPSRPRLEPGQARATDRQT